MCVPMNECMERVLKGDTKAEFTQQANLLGSRTEGNFNTVANDHNDRAHLSCTDLSTPETVRV